MTAAEKFPEQGIEDHHFNVKARGHDDGLSAFVGVRNRLFGIAYRMLGCAAEAEDIVQDVWLRWQFTNRSVVLDSSAFLAATTTRMCINLIQSARSRRETYVGQWLPEPIDTLVDPRESAERNEALKLAMLILLERLGPTERAAYVLREAFDYPYRQIAEILQMKEANVRQLVTRARKHVIDGRRAAVDSSEQERLFVAFMDATQKGDSAALEELFASDIALATVDASTQGIDQTMGIVRRSKLGAISHSRHTLATSACETLPLAG